MDEFWPAFFAGLAVLAVAGAGAWAWRQRFRIKGWFDRNGRLATKAQRMVTASERDDLRDEVVKRARLLKVDLCIKTEGVRPIIATYSDGRRIPFYPDHPSYLRAMRGPVPDLQGRVGRPRKPVSRWTKQECDAWLAAHPV